MNAADKKLNEMNTLADMGHFPVPVNAAATANVLVTLCLTWLLVPRFHQQWAPIAWIAIVLFFNLLPVAALRLTIHSGTQYPTLREMNFVRDQHKFSDWVYVAASANMAFWVLIGWAIFSVAHNSVSLALLCSTAFLVTFSPVLSRLLHHEA